MATTGDITGFFELIIRDVSNDSMRSQPEEYPSVLAVRTSNKHVETDQQFAMLGLPTLKPELSPITFDNIKQGGRREYLHTTSAIGFKASFEAQEDDKYDVVGQTASSLGDSLREGYEEDFAEVWDNSFAGDSSPILVYDGLSIFNAAHTRLDLGATQNNLGTGDISMSLIQSARYHFRNLRNDRGLRDQSHKLATIVIAPDQTAEPLLDQLIGGIGSVSPTTGQPFTTDTRTPHELVSMGTPRKVVYSYLNDTDRTIFLSQKALSMKGGPFAMWRRRPSMTSWDDDEIQGSCFAGSYRNSRGCSQWKGTFGSAGV